MLRKRFALIAVLLTVALLATMSPFALASTLRQTPQMLNIGVIGPIDGPTAQGVSLAVERLTGKGPISGPGGAAFNFSVLAADAKTADDVSAAITQLKGSNVVAIFGPDDEQLAAGSSAALAGAGVPVFVGATSTAVKTGGQVFRTRAASNRQAAALADVMIKDLGKNKFAIFQGNPGVAGPVSEVVTTLTRAGKPPAPPVIQVENGAVTDSAKVLMDSQPDAILAYGDPAQLAQLFLALKAANYAGTFATPVTDTPDFIRNIPPQLRTGLYGVTTWPYSWNSADSSEFTHDYVATFGAVPTALSAAAYDVAVALILGIKDAGFAPNALRTRLLAFPKADSVQGSFNPKLGNGELSASTYVIVTNRFGAPTVLARYDETGRLQLVETPPTATPRPPTPTLVPTEVPAGIGGTVRANVNVRTGPGQIYPVIGQLRRGERVQFVGANTDFTWYVINFRAQQGWVSASFFTDLFGNIRDLPIIAPPPTPVPTPTPPATFTPSPQPFADLIMVSATMNPPVPQPGVPLTLSVVVKNNGNADAGEFAVATSFKPGEVYTAVVVPGLPAGQQTQVNLTNTVNGTGIFTIAIVLDLNNQVNEGPNGEANNKPEFSYRVDRNRIAQGNVNIPPGNSVDFQGGTPDVSYDGTKLVPLNGAKLGLLPGVQMAQIYWDFLSPDKINNAVGIAQADLVPGAVIGIYTAEGKRGALRVSGYAGTTLQLEYFVYDM